MTSDHWTDRLSEYLDGDLDGPDRAACEAHLEVCGTCAETLAELQAVVMEAAALPDELPDRDLWPDIEHRLEPREAARTASRTTRVLPFRMRRVSLTIPQLAAAAIALVVISASSVWLLLPGAPTPGTVAAAPGGAAVPVAMTTQYDDAVRTLEAEFEQRRAALNPETVRVVETNLAIIDSAIHDAQEALAEDPSSGFLQNHLASAMRQKVELLSRVTIIESTGI